MPGRRVDPTSLDAVRDLAAPPDAVFAAFFDPDQVARWWHARRAVLTPRPLGIYALDWGIDDTADPLLGRLGGVLHGTVIDVRAGREFFLADAYWLPPDGDPVGPMAVHVTCEGTATGTRVRLQISGCDDSVRWRRFYRVLGGQWTDALARIAAPGEPPTSGS